MAMAKTRSHAGPGTRPNYGTKPELPPGQEPERNGLPDPLQLDSIFKKTAESIQKSHFRDSGLRNRIEPNHRILLAVRQHLQPCVKLQQGTTQGLRWQPQLRPKTYRELGQQLYTNIRRVGPKQGLKVYQELESKPGSTTFTEDQKPGLVTGSQILLSPYSHHKPRKYTMQMVKLEGDSEQASKFAPKLASRCLEVDHESVINPGLQLDIDPTFEQQLEKPVVLEPRLNPRTSPTFQPQTALRLFLSSQSHLQPLFSLFLLFLLASFMNVTQAGPPRPARAPLLSGQPFIVFWGVKDSSCSNRSNFRSFGIEPEGRVAVFYEDTLGNYPYLVNKDTPVNGGLPQHTKLDLHIQKTQGDVETALPAPRYLGLGVVRWQEWSPQWSRSGDKQGLYVNATRRLLRRFFPDWTRQVLDRWSKVDFEAAAQSVMTETLREVQRSRPKALWGMCPYPRCSNGSPAQTSQSNYTGDCPEEEKSLNDQLLWLWRRSNAIYPLLTLEKIQGGTPGAALFLSNQIRESLRVASLGGSSDDLPVFPLVRTVYASTNTFLSLNDLVTAIGESAALGTAGVVIWDKTEAKTERECEDLRTFTSSVLGPYVSNVTAASRLCSASLCQSRGRCVRLDQDKPTFLHLPPKNQETPDESEDSTDQPDSTPRPELDPAELWKRDFQCQWFSSADGDVSDQPPPKDGAPSVGKRQDSVGQGLDVLGTVSDMISTTTGAYDGQNGGSVGPKTTPLDGGAIKSTSRTIILLLMLWVLCL